MNVWFIGAGPGDVELITVKGARILSEAEVVIYAGSLVSERILTYAKEGAQIHDSSRMSLDEVCAIYDRYRDSDVLIARVHTGDPSMYGAIGEQIAYLRAEGIPFEIIPGVSSFQAAAAVLEQELTLPEVSQSVILSRIAGRTPVPEREELSLLARARATMILFLSIGHSQEVQERLLVEYPPQTPVAIVYRASWPDQKIIRGTVGQLHALVTSHGISRQALIIVGEVLSNRIEPSKLYDPSFSHGYREARG